MAASFVNNGAIDEQMFNDANGEHLVVFAKIEPFWPSSARAWETRRLPSPTWRSSS